MGKQQTPRRNKRLEPNYLRSIVIAHGRSEYSLCDNIGSTLRLSQKIIANDKGRSSIQVTSLDRHLRNRYFKTPRSLQGQFSNINIEKGEIKNCQIFPILDVDDCTEEQKRAYINGDFKKSYWFGNTIVPIYNDPNLEETMKKIGIKIFKKKDYFSIFEPNSSTKEDIIMLWQKFREAKCTNLDEYVGYCLKVKGLI
ncbi:hypothetical protein [Veillonella seminalis]|uniref:hypothetical protein n=1 Tax=Veillonella seminalis TaxID=1502943 RepID=UPI00402AA1A4